MFKKAKQSLEKELTNLAVEDERGTVSRLIRSAELRREYALACMVLEEAKLFEKRGDYSGSFQKYTRALEILEKSRRAAGEKDQREIEAMVAMIKGYDLMTRAESQSSPQFYIQAVESFEKVVGTGLGGNWTLLATGHQHFCRALSTGATLAGSSDEALHQTAVQELENARSFYLRARCFAAAEFVAASRLFLDAYMLMNVAKKQESPRERAKVYTRVERLLRSSAESYRKASQPARQRIALGLLSTMRKERRLASASTFEISRASSILKSITPLEPSWSHHDLSAGLRNFVDANICANMKVSVNNPQLGQDTEVQVDIANAGREAAALARMELAIPEGFDVLEKPQGFRIEAKSLDLNGRKLLPMMTEAFKLVLKPKVEGLFFLSCRIYYVDSTGTEKFHDSDSTGIIVSPIAELLAKAFVEDFKVKRLPSEGSGWRTMMEVVRVLRIPRSRVYGNPREGRAFARPLERLLNTGAIEYRRFPKHRGRGGTVTKLRLCYQTDAAKNFVEQLYQGTSPPIAAPQPGRIAQAQVFEVQQSTIHS